MSIISRFSVPQPMRREGKRLDKARQIERERESERGARRGDGGGENELVEREGGGRKGRGEEGGVR